MSLLFGFHQLKLNSDACSGTDGLPRRLLPDSDSGRCPKIKAELVKAYNDRAAEAYSRVVTRYAMAPHVEDAKDRLIAMGRPVPASMHP